MALWNYTNTNTLRKIWVNTANASAFGLIALDAWNATALAGGVCKEQANAGYFRLEGFTTLDDLEADQPDCIAAGQDFSLVTFSDTDCNNFPAQAPYRCKDSAGKYHQPRIVLYLKTASCNTRSWGNGAVTGGRGGGA